MKTQPSVSETRTLRATPAQINSAVRELTDDILARYSFVTRLRPQSKAMVPLKVEWSGDSDVKLELTVPGLAATTTSITWRERAPGQTEVTVAHAFGIGAAAEKTLPGGFGEGPSRAAVRQTFSEITRRIVDRSLDV